MKANKLLVMVIAVAVLWLSLQGCCKVPEKPSRIQLNAGAEILIPDGYTLIEASAYGQHVNNLTLYLRHEKYGRIYEYEIDDFHINDGKAGKFGAEIILPEGYSLVGVSAYGRFANNRTFYCQKNGTDKIFVCQLDE